MRKRRQGLQGGGGGLPMPTCMHVPSKCVCPQPAIATLPLDGMRTSSKSLSKRGVIPNPHPLRCAAVGAAAGTTMAVGGLGPSTAQKNEYIDEANQKNGPGTVVNY